VILMRKIEREVRAKYADRLKTASDEDRRKITVQMEQELKQTMEQAGVFRLPGLNLDVLF